MSLELRTRRTEALSLSEPGGWQPALEIRYRAAGTRRWTKFLLVSEKGQTLDELEGYAQDAAALHARGVGAARRARLRIEGGR